MMTWVPLSLFVFRCDKIRTKMNVQTWQTDQQPQSNGGKVSTTIQEGTEKTDTMISGGYQGLDKTLYQEMKSQGQGQQQQDKVTTGVLIISVLIYSNYYQGLAAARIVPYRYKYSQNTQTPVIPVNLVILRPILVCQTFLWPKTSSPMSTLSFVPSRLDFFPYSFIDMQENL